MPDWLMDVIAWGKQQASAEIGVSRHACLMAAAALPAFAICGWRLRPFKNSIVASAIAVFLLLPWWVQAIGFFAAAIAK